MAASGPQILRHLNQATVLRVLRQLEPCSRADLARVTGLAKPTVSLIVDELVAKGIVKEHGYGPSRPEGGRRARLLELERWSVAYAGVHLGVHRTRVGVADASGVLQWARTCPTIRRGPEAALDRAAELLDAGLAALEVPSTRLGGVGVAVAGTVEQPTGRCRLAPHLGWRDVPMGELAAGRFGRARPVPVVVRNIAQAAAVAEGSFGAASGVGSFVWIYLGSGVGGALVDDGRLFEGRSGLAGEIGHAPIAVGGRRCACGRSGCLETVAGGAALVAGAERLGLDLGAAGHENGAAAVAAAARRGDERAVRLLGEAGEAVGRAAAALMNLLNPELVVVGGPVAQAGPSLWGPLRDAAARAMEASVVPVVPSELTEMAEVSGAVLSAMDLVARGERSGPAQALAAAALAGAGR